MSDYHSDMRTRNLWRGCGGSREEEWPVDVAAVTLALEEGADVNVQHGKDRFSALHCAVNKAPQSTDALELLLAHPAVNVNARTGSSWSPLMLAAAAGYAEVVGLLLAHGAVDVNAANKNGSTALMLACWCGSLPVVSALLARPELEIGAKNVQGLTATGYANKGGYSAVSMSIAAEVSSRRAQALRRSAAESGDSDDSDGGEDSPPPPANAPPSSNSSKLDGKAATPWLHIQRLGNRKTGNGWPPPSTRDTTDRHVDRFR